MLDNIKSLETMSKRMKVIDYGLNYDSILCNGSKLGANIACTQKIGNGKNYNCSIDFGS